MMDQYQPTNQTDVLNVLERGNSLTLGTSRLGMCDPSPPVYTKHHVDF